MPNLTNSQKPKLVFWPLGAEAAQIKIPGAGATWENNQEPGPLVKSGASAAKKFS